MVKFKGTRSMQDVNLVAAWDDRHVSKGADGDVKLQFMDIQVDARDGRAAGQQNLHLGASGRELSSAYSSGQLDAMVEAAGSNVEKGADGVNRATFKASLFVSRDRGFVVDTRSLQGSDFEIHDKLMEVQEQFGAEVAQVQPAQPKVVAAGNYQAAGPRKVAMNADHKASIESLDAKSGAGLENPDGGYDH